MVEKSMLIGFGLFTLIVFLSIIQPFFGALLKFYDEDKQYLENIENFIEEIDCAIIYSISNPEEVYEKGIIFPRDLNITISGNEVKYNYLINNNMYSNSKRYGSIFHTALYHNITSTQYILQVFFESNYVRILFK
ncbi:MAG: hypothetical protein ACTSRT_09345 [Promethearchaeota archaeon]